MYFLTKIGLVIGLVILPSCGPMSHTLFTLGGHNFTLGGMVISNTVKKVIENDSKDECVEGWDTPSITIPCEDNK